MDTLQYPQPSDSNDPLNKPFGIELAWEREGDRGHLRPRSTLFVNRSLRTSGLLLALAPEDAKMLLFVLTFLHPNGFCHATVPELCHWTKLSQAKLRARMCRLTQFEWRGAPLVTDIRRGSGLDAYTPSREVLEVSERFEPRESDGVPVIRTVGREAVVAQSRAKYARPRAEVERQIAELNGWEIPDEHATPEEKARAATRDSLRMIGLSRDQANDLLSRFDLEAINRQIEWLPFRNAKSPARFLLAAVEGDYDPPPSFRHRSPEATTDDRASTDAEPGYDALDDIEPGNQPAP